MVTVASKKSLKETQLVFFGYNLFLISTIEKKNYL